MDTDELTTRAHISRAPTWGRRVPATMACVVLNHGNWPEVADTVDSCIAGGIAPTNVFFVDNASPIDPTAAVRGRYRDIRVVRLSSNGGYAQGMNIAVALVLDDAPEVDRLLLLTHEVVFDDEMVALLSDRLDADGEIAAVGPLLFQRDRPDELFSAGGTFIGTSVRPGHLREPARSGKASWLDGACVLYRAAAFAAADGFDERYFMYFEDVDLHCRLRRRGWKVGVVQHARALQRSRAIDVSGSWFANRLIFAARNFGVRAGLSEAVSISRLAIGRARLGDVSHLRALLASIPRIVRRTAVYRPPARRLDRRRAGAGNSGGPRRHDPEPVGPCRVTAGRISA